MEGNSRVLGVALSQVLLAEDHSQYIGVFIILCRNFDSELGLKIRISPVQFWVSDQCFFDSSSVAPIFSVSLRSLNS